MPIVLRPADQRGHARLEWLDSRHSFSFADYHDPRHMGFRSLRVINEDIIAPGGGFAEHGHRDMEIITYVVNGTLAHKDSTGGAALIRPGEVQRMTAGSGIRHSEYNASTTESVHLLQIWILPEVRNLPPGYEQRAFPPEQRRNRLVALAAPSDGDALALHQDAVLWSTHLDSGQTVRHALAPNRGAWLQVVGGAVSVNGSALSAGDGAAVEGEAEIILTAGRESDILLFDLA